MNKPLLSAWIVGSLALVAGASIRFDGGPALECDGQTVDNDLREQKACGTGSTQEEADANAFNNIHGIPTCKECTEEGQVCAQDIALYGWGVGPQCYEDFQGVWHCCFSISPGTFYSNTCRCEDVEPPEE